MDWKKENRLLHGRSKKVYEIQDETNLVLVFQNEFIPPGTKETIKIMQRKESACAVSAFLFQYLGSYHINTHFLDTDDKAEMLVKRLDMIPVEFLIWNIASGGLGRRFGLKEGSELKYPVLECYLKNENLKYPLMNMDHIQAMDLASPEEMTTIDRLCRKVNALLKSFFERRQLKLISLRLEFGKQKDKILLGDELTPESLRLWDIEAGERLDCYGKNNEAAYKSLCEQITG